MVNVNIALCPIYRRVGGQVLRGNVYRPTSYSAKEIKSCLWYRSKQAKCYISKQSGDINLTYHPQHTLLIYRIEC